MESDLLDRVHEKVMGFKNVVLFANNLDNLPQKSKHTIIFKLKII